MAVEVNFIDRRQQAFIRFNNNTCYSIEIIWINFDNKENTYSILAPNKFLDVNTYSTHSWIFRFGYTYLSVNVFTYFIFY